MERIGGRGSCPGRALPGARASWGFLAAYWELMKPKGVSLPVSTTFAGMVLAAATEAAALTARTLLLGLAAISAGCAGCNAMTCYIDRDVDALMARTKERPLSSGRIEPVPRGGLPGTDPRGRRVVARCMCNAESLLIYGDPNVDACWEPMNPAGNGEALAAPGLSPASSVLLQSPSCWWRQPPTSSRLAPRLGRSRSTRLPRTSC